MYTRNTWLGAARGATWFRLDRHDDPDPEPDPKDPKPADPDPDPADPADPPEPADPEPDPEDDPDPEGADKLGDAGKRALEKIRSERAEAKKEAAAAKKRAAAAEKKVQEYEDRDKTALEKAEATADRAAKQAEAANERAVSAEVRALAAGKFADPTDASETLMRDPAKYIGDDGSIDTDAIDADLADLLERKPHWAASVPEPVTDPAAKPKPKPKPDPGQGPRPNALPKDFRTATPEEVDAELSKLGVRRHR